MTSSQNGPRNTECEGKNESNSYTIIYQCYQYHTIGDNNWFLHNQANTIIECFIFERFRIDFHWIISVDPRTDLNSVILLQLSKKTNTTSFASSVGC